MPLTFTSGIAAEIDQSNLAAIDLIEVDFGNNIKRYWSNQLVTSKYLQSSFPGISRFEPRIINVGTKRWSLGPSSDSLSITVAKKVGDPSSTTYEDLSDFAKQFGMGIFEGAHLRYHRLFPNRKEVYKNWWFGYGLAPVWSEDSIEWTLDFGLGNFRQTFGRRLESTCSHIFAGGPSSDCPYDPLSARGVPQSIILVNAGAGTDNTKVIGSGFNSAKVGWIVWNRTNNAFAKITKIVSDTEISITGVISGDGGTATFASTNKLSVGPPFNHCPKTIPACKEREMFGASEHNTTGAGDKRRYFGGNAEASVVTFWGRTPRSAGGDRFQRARFGNESLEGKVIPVVVGFYRMLGIPSNYWAPAGDFQHGFWLLCEGEIVDMAAPLVNGKPPDDNPPAELDSAAEVITNDSFIKWGTWATYKLGSATGIEDSLALNANDAKRIRRAIGRRKSFGVMSGFTLDTYGNGTNGHPFLFNGPFGGGVSLHGFAALRQRIETQQDILDALSLDIDIWGLLVHLPATMSNNSEDGTLFNLQGEKYTGYSNPIQFAWHFCTDPRWGVSIAEKRILESSTITWSDFCEEFISSTQGVLDIELTGTVTASSADTLGTSNRAFIFTKDATFQTIPTNSLNGRKIIVNPGNSKAFSAFVIKNTLLTRAQPQIIRAEIPGIARFKAGLIDDEPRGTVLILSEDFPSSKKPAVGNSFTIPLLQGPLVKRFKANGILAEDITNGEMLQNILDNVFGTFRTNADQIEFLIRRKLTPTELNTIVSDGVFTDRGTKPNIIRDESTGKSTVRVWRGEIGSDIPNEFIIEFADLERNFQLSRVKVFHEEAQIRAETVLAESGARKINREVVKKLNLTSTKDQAVRLLVLHSRQAFVENLFCSFTTSLKIASKYLPGNVIAVDSETISGNFNPQLLPQEVMSEGAMFFRILTKEELDKWQLHFECQVHVNGIFETFGSDFGIIAQPIDVLVGRGKMPLNIKPETPTERIIIENDGKVRNFIQVKVTYPKL